MTPHQRLAGTRRIAVNLAERSEGEADTILRLCGSASVTPGDWGRGSPDEKIGGIMSLLMDASIQLVESLLGFLDQEEAYTQSDLTRAPSTSVAPTLVEPSSDGPIFVVHGHARAALHEAVRVIERGTRREVIVLHEQANAGRTILEKFENHAADAAFAVVLLTADDEGGSSAQAVRRPRGRQNVIFELGFFFAKLGRQRVAVLLSSGVEKPSDIDGLVYISLDEAGAWKQTLGRELAAAGIPVDYSRMP